MQPEIVSEQMINGLICNNFTFYRTLIEVHIWWAKLFKAVLILLIAIRLFELLAPAGFGIMCLLLCFFLIYSFYFMLSHCLLLLSHAITVSLLVFLLCCLLAASVTIFFLFVSLFSFLLPFCLLSSCFGILPDFSGGDKLLCPLLDKFRSWHWAYAFPFS